MAFCSVGQFNALRMSVYSLLVAILGQAAKLIIIFPFQGF